MKGHRPGEVTGQTDAPSLEQWECQDQKRSISDDGKGTNRDSNLNRKLSESFGDILTDVPFVILAHE